MRRRWIMLFAIIGLVLLLDQVTKRQIIETMLVGQTITPIPALVPYFQITYSQNMGAAFGFLPQGGDLFLVIALVIVVAMIYFYPRLPENGHFSRIGMGLICGGALGNALDRLQHGVVVDFIHYQIPGVISNVSNIADHAVVLGVIIIFIESWLLERKQKQVEAVPVEGQADSTDG